MSKRKSLLEHALEYYRRGWSIIPIPPGQKAARIKWKKYQDTRANEEQIIKWFSKPCNIAVVLGPASGDLCCRDYDEQAGNAEFEQWTHKHSALFKQLPITQTADGHHVYFEGSVEGIHYIKDSDGNKSGELRGSGGYCLLPPSVHPDGPVYQWVNHPNGSILDVDPELAGFITNVTERTENTERTERTDENRGELIEIVRGGSVHQAIKATLPSEYGTRHRMVFEFARCLYSMPHYTDADPKDLKSFFVEWHKQALPYIRTQEFEESWIDFLKAWPLIKCKIGEEPMTKIFERAQKAEPPKIAVDLHPDNQPLQLFITLCRELQQEAGQSPFFLACKTGGKYFKVSKMTISRWFFLLEAEDVVKLIAKGGTKENPLASRYKYIAN